MTAVAGRRRARLLLLALAVVPGAALGGCADVPVARAPAPATAPAPAVVPSQAQHVRAEVAGRLQAASASTEEELVAAAATGPAEASLLFRQDIGSDGDEPAADGPDDAVTSLAADPAAVLVNPVTDGWPRWFATVTDGADGADGLPVLELFTSADVRSPYRLWGRMDMLPDAVLPAFPDADLGAPAQADGTGPGAVATAGTDEDGEPVEPTDAEELQAALSGLAARYASVLAEGDSSPSAAEFEPDAFAAAVRTRAEAERTAVAGVARTTVEHEPFGEDGLLYAATAADGDVLAVTAVQTTTTVVVEPGAGSLLLGEQLREATGIEQVDDTLTTRSVAALAFVVPAEQGAIRLVAVGEGLVAAEGS